MLFIPSFTKKDSSLYYDDIFNKNGLDFRPIFLNGLFEMGLGKSKTQFFKKCVWMRDFISLETLYINVVRTFTSICVKKICLF